MKYFKLKEIVTEEAETLKLSAGYMGSYNDGGSNSLLCKLEEYKQELVIKYDFKPSEYYKLNNLEIGEPEEFSDLFVEYRKN